nr:protein IQ-DOMAIN 1 isoform X2 [Ipomoea batatas]GMD21098.1 protein IQ-DOMAIN 1 isoform X2 [Ipomoea batatas]
MILYPQSPSPFPNSRAEESPRRSAPLLHDSSPLRPSTIPSSKSRSALAKFIALKDIKSRSALAKSIALKARRALRLERIGEASSYSLRMAARPWETRLLEQATSNSSKPCTAKVRKNNVTKRISTKPPEAVPKFL